MRRRLFAVLALVGAVAAASVPLVGQATPGVTVGEVGSGQLGCTVGEADTVRMQRPSAAVRASDGTVYVADADNHRLLAGRPGPDGELVMQPYGGACGEAAFSGDGGDVRDARFFFPIDLALDDDDNLYVADTYNHRIRRIDTSTDVVTTVAGSGTVGNPKLSFNKVHPRSADLAYPHGLTVWGGELIIADSFANRVLTVDLAKNQLSNERINLPPRDFKNGRPVSDSLLVPTAVRIDPTGRVLYIADAFHRRVLRIDRTSGWGATVAGHGAREVRPVHGAGELEPAAHDPSLVYPFSIEVDSVGNLFVADSGRGTVSLVAPGGVLIPVVGLSVPVVAPRGGDVDGSGPDFPERGDHRAAWLTYLGQPGHLHMDDGGDLWLADRLAHRIRRVPVVDCPQGLHVGVALYDATGGTYDWGDPTPGNPWGPAVEAGCDVGGRTVRGTPLVGRSSQHF